MQKARFTILALALGTALAAPALATEGKAVRITGEVIDTWCYFSGVMGGPEAVVGSAHHTCAMWCAAGGIPVGVLADDGTVYMVMKWQGAPDIANGTALLDAQSHRITVEGTLHVRDDINYLMVADVVADEGIVNRSHEDFGVVPPFAIPELSQ